MSNTAYRQTMSYDELQTSYAQKAVPVAPRAEAKPVRKADGAFRTISEVADELDVPQHVLRFWETKFSQVKPLKRGGGRRYYRPEDVALLKHIHHLLYTEGYTIKGAQKLLKGQGKNQIAAQVFAAEEAAASPPAPQPKTAMQEAPASAAAATQQQSEPAKVYNLSDRQRSALEGMLAELKDLRSLFPEEAA
ncbi:MAG: MerR family transcriptional regulator [Micavibrio sp.]